MEKSRACPQLFNKILNFLGSVRLALILFWLLIIVSFIGAVLPQELRQYVFAAPWFLGLLMVFSLNILICTINRISVSRKKIGSTIVHLAVLLILFGSLISYLFSIRGVMELEEGQSLDRINLGCKIQPLGFRVHLDDFSLVWYSTTPDKYEVKAYVVDRNLKESYKLNKSQEQKIGNSGYSFAVVDYFTDFSIDKNMKAYNKSALPNNPAVLLRINTPRASEERWVFAKYPGMGSNRDPNIKFRFNYQPMVKEYRSQVKIIDDSNNQTISSTIKVNSPVTYKGYTFYQSGYDQDNLQFTSLDVVHDPGVGFVFTGFLILNAGLVITFYPKLKQGANRKK